MKNYYHIIEEKNYDLIGWHGCYESIQEAEKEICRLQDLFEDVYFYIHQSNDHGEPPITTV